MLRFPDGTVYDDVLDIGDPAIVYSALLKIHTVGVGLRKNFFF
jgi:hypothetical protein